MDAQLKELLEMAGLYTLIGGSVYACTRAWYLKRKSDNETYSERTKAAMEAEKQRIELMNTPQFKDYQEKRVQVAKELIKKDSTLTTWTSCLQESLDSIVGNSPID
jgi:hypothetical protein